MKKMGMASLVVILGSSALAAPPKSTPALLEKGEASYARNCLACHGEKGDGKGPTGAYLNPTPRDFLSEPFKNGNKPEEVFQTITKGMPGSTMVAFGTLPEEERWALTHYVLGFQKSQGKEAKKAAPKKGKK